MVPLGLILFRHWLLSRRHPRELGQTAIAEDWLDISIDSNFGGTRGNWVRVAVYDSFIVVAYLVFLVDDYRVIRTAMRRPGFWGTVQFRIRLQNRWVTLVIPDESPMLRALEQRLEVARVSWSP